MRLAGSFLVLRVVQLCFAQIQVPFDPAPCLIFQFAVPVSIVDVLAFGSDQQEFNLILQIDTAGVLGVAVVATISGLQPISVVCTQRLNYVLGQLALHGQLVES
jgi:hypothetical protein